MPRRLLPPYFSTANKGHHSLRAILVSAGTYEHIPTWFRSHSHTSSGDAPTLRFTVCCTTLCLTSSSNWHRRYFPRCEHIYVSISINYTGSTTHYLRLSICGPLCAVRRRDRCYSSSASKRRKANESPRIGLSSPGVTNKDVLGCIRAA